MTRSDDPTVPHPASCLICDAWTSDADTLEDGVCGECVEEADEAQALERMP